MNIPRQGCLRYMEAVARQLPAQLVLVGHNGVDQEFADSCVALLFHEIYDPLSS
jgi:hypothetical protein